jgi:hypothetical protein
MASSKLKWQEPQAYKLAHLAPPLIPWWGKALIFAALGFGLLCFPLFVNKKPLGENWTLTCIFMFILSAMVVYMLPWVERIYCRQVTISDKGITVEWLQFYTPHIAIIPWKNVLSYKFQQETIGSKTYDVLVLELENKGHLEVALAKRITVEAVDEWFVRNRAV